MFFLYQFLLSFLIIISPGIILYRVYKNKEDSKRYTEKFSITSKKRKSGNLIWFHGASVGEILSVIPIIKNYEKNRKIHQILVTSSTLSSSKIIQKYKFKKVTHQFFPIDHFYFVDKFLEYWKPNLAIFIESEIWPCMFKKLDSKKIPLILLNARLTKNTFNKWMKIKFFSKSIFNKIKTIYPQNIETKKFLKKIYSKKISQIGNLKFIQNNNLNINKISSKLKLYFRGKQTWVASSTHRNEEIFCVKAHLELKKKIKNLITIIIPRHIHRVSEISEEIKKFNLKIGLHSNRPKSLNNVDIYLVDTFGETNIFHQIGATVFLGGSITKRGGQNPLEAARHGAKILHGPNIENFKDVYKLLKKLKISKKITTSKQLASFIKFNKNKKSGIKIKNIGEIILKKTIKELDSLINNELEKT